MSTSNGRRTRREILEERLGVVEACMTRCLRTRSIVQAVQRRYPDISPRTVYRDMRRVREQWERESHGIDRETKRRAIEQTLREAIALAFERKQPVLDAKGRPIVRDDGEAVTVPDPDVRAVIRGAAVLSRLHGLETIRLETEVQTQVEALLDGVKQHMPADAYEQLVRALGIVMGIGDPATTEQGGARH